MKCYLTGVLLYLGFFTSAHCQDIHLASKSIFIKVSGSSTLHSWEMSSRQGDCTAITSSLLADSLRVLRSLSFSTLVHNLHSGHSAFDKSAYAALKADIYPSITWKMETLLLRPDGSITGAGTLCIAGVSRQEVIQGHWQLNNAGECRLICTNELNMHNYNITPPSILFGAIKAGEMIQLYIDVSFFSIASFRL